MNLLNNIQAIGKASAAWTKNHKAELLLAGSIASLGGAIIFAVKAGINTPDILEDHHERVRDVKIKQATEKEPNKFDLIREYLITAGRLGIEYGPSVACAAGVVVCECAVYGILKKEALTAWAAYTAICSDFRLYRDRVIADKGEEADKYYMTGEKPKTVTITDEEGKKEKVKVYPTLPNGSIASPYAFKFGKYKENGDLNKQWENDRSFAMHYLLGQQDYLNRQLKYRCTFNDKGEVIKRGSVFLNEIRDLCGEDPITMGQYVGNLYSNGEPGCNGFIDFNIIETTEIDPYDGREIPVFWIDPNVDGMISDLLEKLEKHPFVPSYQSEYWEDISI